MSHDVNREGLCRAAHPLRSHGYDFDVPLLSGEHVTADTGTGFVHTAPGHGEEDFELMLSAFDGYAAKNPDAFGIVHGRRLVQRRAFRCSPASAS